MKTILVVDDEYAIVWSLSTELQDEGYRVVAAANGKEALERISEELPALVITDVMMPIMDGRELIAALGRDGRTRDIPVIVMSAVARAGLDGAMRSAAFLRKPFGLKALLGEVARLIGPGTTA